MLYIIRDNSVYIFAATVGCVMKIVNNKLATENKAYLVMFSAPRVYHERDMLRGEIRQGYCVGSDDGQRFPVLEVYY